MSLYELIRDILKTVYYLPDNISSMSQHFHLALGPNNYTDLYIGCLSVFLRLRNLDCVISFAVP